MFQKINIYTFNRARKFWQYECSTNWSKTCKEAKEKFLRIHNYIDKTEVKASYK